MSAFIIRFETTLIYLQTQPYMIPKDFHQLLLERHSIRRYTSQPLDPEEVKLIIEAGLLAPTSKNSRPWQFIVVEDKDTLSRLADCKVAGTVPLKTCVMAVVVILNPSLSAAWVEDGSVAAGFMMLQATALGLGSCWVEVHGRTDAQGLPSEDSVRKTLGIPDEYVPLCIVTFGHSDEQRKNVDPSKLLWEKVHIGEWVQPE